MNIVDIIIIIFILVSGVTGFKRGIFKQLVICIGTILVFYLAYQFKDYVGNYLLLKLPLFDFPNFFKGAITLNILVYQSIAFLLVLALLLVIYNILLSVTGIFEKILKFTVVLSIPSKILGFLAGLVEGYVIAFVILFFLTQPVFNFDLFQDSKLSTPILTTSPVLTNITSDSLDLIQEIYKLKDESDKDILNSKVLDLMLKNDFVDYNTVKELHDSGKLQFDGIDAILERYKKVK